MAGAPACHDKPLPDTADDQRAVRMNAHRRMVLLSVFVYAQWMVAS